MEEEEKYFPHFFLSTRKFMKLVFVLFYSSHKDLKKIEKRIFIQFLSLKDAGWMMMITFIQHQKARISTLKSKIKISR